MKMGLKLDESMTERFYYAREQAKKWKREEETLRVAMLAGMGQNNILEFPRFVLTAFEHERRGIDLETLRLERPDIAEQYTIVSIHRRVEIHKRDESI